MFKIVSVMIVLIALFLFLGMGYFGRGETVIKNKDMQAPVYIIYADKISSTLIKEMEEKYGLHCCGSGGQLATGVGALAVDFEIRKKVTIEEAREMIVTATERFLELINSDEKIRPYLKEYPFKPNRAEILLAFRNKDGKDFFDGTPVLVFQVNNKIFYRRAIPIDKNNPYASNLRNLYEEPYEKALEIVKNSN